MSKPWKPTLPFPTSALASETVLERLNAARADENFWLVHRLAEIIVHLENEPSKLWGIRCAENGHYGSRSGRKPLAVSARTS